MKSCSHLKMRCVNILLNTVPLCKNAVVPEHKPDVFVLEICQIVRVHSPTQSSEELWNLVSMAKNILSYFNTSFF